MKMLGNDVFTQAEFDKFMAETLGPLHHKVAVNKTNSEIHLARLAAELKKVKMLALASIILSAVSIFISVIM